MQVGAGRGEGAACKQPQLHISLQQRLPAGDDVAGQAAADLGGCLPDHLHVTQEGTGHVSGLCTCTAGCTLTPDGFCVPSQPERALTWVKWPVLGSKPLAGSY